MGDVQRRNDDGSFSDAAPLGWQGSGIDFEVTGKPGAGFEWTAWDEDVCVGKGTARTRFGLLIGLLFARARLESRHG